MKSEFKPWQFEGDREVQRRKWRKAYWKNHPQRLAAMKKYYWSHREYFRSKRKRYQLAHRQHCNFLQRIYWTRKHQIKKPWHNLNFNFYQPAAA